MNHLPISIRKKSREPSKNTVELRFQLGFDFVLSPATHEIMSLHEEKIVSTIKVEPKVMEVLICLVEQEGQVVLTEDLIEKIWDNYGGAKEALMQAVSKLRKLLQDDAQKQRAIQTISKKGYRLLLPVKALSPDAYQSLLQGEPAKAKQMNQKVGLFTGFVERLTQPKFFFAFLFLSVVVLMALGILYQIVFWW